MFHSHPPSNIDPEKGSFPTLSELQACVYGVVFVGFMFFATTKNELKLHFHFGLVCGFGFSLLPVLLCISRFEFNPSHWIHIGCAKKNSHKRKTNQLRTESSVSFFFFFPLFLSFFLCSVVGFLSP